MPEWFIALLVVAAGISLWTLADFLPGPLQPVVEPDGVTVRLFGSIRLLHIPFDQIVGIGPKTWRQLLSDGDLSATLRMGLRVFRKSVVISRVGRSPVLVAPKDPDAFIREVKLRLALPAA